MPIVKNARTTAFASYLVYRHADRAFRRGQLGAGALAAAARALRARVEPVWEQIFPGQESAAYAWVLERLQLLEAGSVLPPEAVARIRAVAAAKAVKAPVAQWGALALLYRVHVLYLLASDMADQGGIAPAALDRLRENLHQLSLTALNREIKSAGPQGAATLHLVVEEARHVARALVAEHALSDADGHALLASLGGADPVEATTRIAEGEGNCLVCGDALAERGVVYCAACETPHHPDCWSWVGRCSTFACGCTDAVPRPGASAAPRFDLTPAKDPTVPPVRAWHGNPLAAVAVVAVILGALILSSLF